MLAHCYSGIRSGLWKCLGGTPKIYETLRAMMDKFWKHSKSWKFRARGFRSFLLICCFKTIVFGLNVHFPLIFDLNESNFCDSSIFSQAVVFMLIWPLSLTFENNGASKDANFNSISLAKFHIMVLKSWLFLDFQRQWRSEF